MRRLSNLAAIAALALVAACGEDEEACVVGQAGICGDGLVCEEIADGTTGCFAPVHVVGTVVDAETLAPIAGALVVAIDANSAARSDVVTTDVAGNYTLPVPTRRNTDGTLVMTAVTLRVDAAGYIRFATPPRVALPVELSTAMCVEGAECRVMNASTEVRLNRRTDITGTTARVEGALIGAAPAGALVVAEAGGTAVATALTSTAGNYVLFDVPVGAARIAAYRAGLTVTPVDATIAAPTTRVDLVATEQTLGAVSGTVQFANAPGGSVTTVILTVESTFDPDVNRGETPAGLRATDVTGAFSIDHVPPGRYVVLAGFENDGLVRDPDTSIGGTEIVHIEVPPGGMNLDLSEGFKVTGALAVRSPGAELPEVVTDAEPTFTWEDDSSEDGYELEVRDALGTLVLEADVARVTGSSDVSHTWTGATLVPGMTYQFRAYSYHDEMDGSRTRISATEDLRGVFEIPAAASP